MEIEEPYTVSFRDPEWLLSVCKFNIWFIILFTKKKKGDIRSLDDLFFSILKD